MKYRNFPQSKENISALGLGCMRFPRKGRKIDQEKTNALVAAAIDKGISFFDTAYVYFGSELALGTALKACGKRGQINIATKLPHYICKRYEDFDIIFDTQLKRLKTDYVDYYFIHMLQDIASWERLKSFGIEKWILIKKAEGKIKKIGFSFHCSRHAFVELLDVYNWEFCMVQYNYYDEFNQAGASGVARAYEKGIPVFAMEPLRGGLLASQLPKKAVSVLKNAKPERAPVWWALQWLWAQPGITMALSGMSSIKELEENTAACDDYYDGILNDDDMNVYKEVVGIINKAYKIPCTSCGYCVPCPRGVDIPHCFSCYNETYTLGWMSGLGNYIQSGGLLTANHTDASKCTSCGVCEKKCPQNIQITKELKKVNRRMAAFIIKPILSVVRKLSGLLK